MPHYSTFAGFNKPYTAMNQWSGKEMKALGRVIVSIVATMILDPFWVQQGPFNSAMLCIRNQIYFQLMSEYQNHTNGTIKYMEDYLS
jgi:hypothetical protein